MEQPGPHCLQRLTPQGEEAKAAFTFTTGEEGAKFDASGSTAPGGVAYYEWQLNEFAGQTPIETTSPTFEWGNTKGVLNVALTVFAKDGTSNGTMHVVYIGQIPPPTITKVTPIKGAVAGGARVIITGTSFTSGETTVKFGALNAASFAVNSLTRITAISPPGEVAGTVDVTVTTHYGTSPTSAADHYTFGPPTVTGLSPNTGSKAGKTSVTVTGAGFAPGATGTTFKVGRGQATSVNCSSTTECAFLTPAAKAVGTVDVKATVNKLSSVKNPAAQFTYS